MAELKIDNDIVRSRILIDVRQTYLFREICKNQ